MNADAVTILINELLALRGVLFSLEERIARLEKSPQYTPKPTSGVFSADMSAPETALDSSSKASSLFPLARIEDLQRALLQGQE